MSKTANQQKFNTKSDCKYSSEHDMWFSNELTADASQKYCWKKACNYEWFEIEKFKFHNQQEINRNLVDF